MLMNMCRRPDLIWPNDLMIVDEEDRDFRRIEEFAYLWFSRTQLPLQESAVASLSNTVRLVAYQDVDIIELGSAVAVKVLERRPRTATEISHKVSVKALEPVA